MSLSFEHPFRQEFLFFLPLGLPRRFARLLCATPSAASGIWSPRFFGLALSLSKQSLPGDRSRTAPEE